MKPEMGYPDKRKLVHPAGECRLISNYSVHRVGLNPAGVTMGTEHRQKTYEICVNLGL